MKDKLSISQLMNFIRGSVSPKFIIDSKDKLSQAAATFGMLPFFPNNIKGFSVDEMCAPGMLFGGNYDEGCWEWKGPVIRRRESAYGKFFKRKAGFVSLDLLPDFLNYRRRKYPIKRGETEEMLWEIIRENDSLTSTELRKLIFGGRNRNWDDIPDLELNPVLKRKSKSFESLLQRLQMGGWIIISDFEYKKTKSGERYGWGVARYSTPEMVFGDHLEGVNGRDPQESFERLIERMKKLWPSIKRQSLEALIK